MTSGGRVEFRVLGPLEVFVGGAPIALGGAKQRAVLAALLLRPDEVLSVEKLIDEVWGDSAPPSASHGLEAYVSRIRQLLNGHGPTLTRRGAGYLLDLRGAELDADSFVRGLEEASDEFDAGHPERASALVTDALGLWHGPALADVQLASAGRAEAERLEELRLRAFELHFDCELERGRHPGIVGELQVLVGQNPYRERFVAQLMLALYRAGRHAEALDAYEQMRRRLDADLGLQPSPELQQLSAQIVRQEPRLRQSPDTRIDPGHVIRPRARRLSGLVLVGAIVAAALALSASGGAPQRTPGSLALPTTRVALVVPADPAGAGATEPRIRLTTSAFRETSIAWGHETEILVADEISPSEPEVERTARQLETGRFRAVLVLGDGATARALVPTVQRLTTTRFVFVDASLNTLGLEGVPNATAFRYAVEQPSRLAGYLSALIGRRGRPPAAHPDVVSVVAAPRTPESERDVRAFVRGAKSRPGPISVRAAYVPSVLDKTGCERMANRQIDAGSDVIFAMGGACAHAALAVASTRGVWGIRMEEDGVRDGPHILATISKWWEKSVVSALDNAGLDALPRGRDVVLGLADDYAVDMWGEDAAEPVWSKVVKLCSSIRAHTEDNA